MKQQELLQFRQEGGGENRKVRITIQIKQIIAPESFKVQGETNNESNHIESALMKILNRVDTLVTVLLLKHRWIIIGYIVGKNEIPIVISYYELLNLFAYSQRLDTDPLFEIDNKNLLDFSAN